MMITLNTLLGRIYIFISVELVAWFVSGCPPRPHVVIRSGLLEAAESRVCDWFLPSARTGGVNA